MTPIKHPLCNDVLRAPEGDDNCEDLHIRREDESVWSFWIPNKEELSAIIRGGSVVLRVCGQTHPPFSIMATTPTDDQAIAVTAEEASALNKANVERHAALMDITKRAIATWTREAPDSRDRQRIADEFLDLILFNKGKGDLVRDLRVEPEPEVKQSDIDRYRADAEEWRAEAERWRNVAQGSTATDGQRTTDAGGWMNYCLEAEQEWARSIHRLGHLQSVIDLVIDQLNRASVENTEPEQS